MYKKIWLLPIFLLIGCGGDTGRRYCIDPGDYTFKYIKTQTAESLQALIDVYKKNDEIIAENGYCRVGAGYYAEYGFLLMQHGEVSQGRELLYKEIELFPESKTFMLRALGEKE